MSKEIIKITDFSYAYEDTDELALKKISLTVNEGDFVGIVGCNKAGKSTLCQVMVGVLPYVLGGRFEGTVIIDGNDLEKSNGATASDIVGIVFQDAESQFTQETVEDEIAFSMCNFGYERSLMRTRVEAAAKACGLWDKLSRSPFQLSGGQQQRLAVACILALQPRVIILDESTSQLDPVGRDEVFTLIKELHQNGSTVIMVDHNIEKIAQYADKVAIMRDGELKIYGDVRDVFSRCDDLSAMNIRVPQVAEAANALKSQLIPGQLPVNMEQAKVSYAPLVRGKV